MFRYCFETILKCTIFQNVTNEWKIQKNKRHDQKLEKADREEKKKNSYQSSWVASETPGRVIPTLLTSAPLTCRCGCAESEAWVGRRSSEEGRRGKGTRLKDTGLLVGAGELTLPAHRKVALLSLL